MIKNFAVIQTSTNKVQQMVLLEDGHDWPVPSGCFVQEASEYVQPGDTWNGSRFVERIADEDYHATKLKAQGLVMEAEREIFAMLPMNAPPEKVDALVAYVEELKTCIANKTGEANWPTKPAV